MIVQERCLEKMEIVKRGEIFQVLSCARFLLNGGRPAESASFRLLPQATMIPNSIVGIVAI